VYNFLNSAPAFRVTYAGIRADGAAPGPVPKPVPIDSIKKEEPAPASIADETAKAKQEIAPVSTKVAPKPIIKAKPKAQASETFAKKEHVTDPPAAEKTRVEKNAAPSTVQIQPKPKETPAPVKETVRSTAPAKSENKAYEPANAKRAEASDQ